MKTIPMPPAARCFPVHQVRGATTFTPDNDTRVILWLACQTSGDILEIGCNAGLTSARLAMMFPEKLIFGVDLPEPLPQSHVQASEAIPASEVGLLAAPFSNFRLVRSRSDDIDYHSIPSVTMVFIDGDHSREAVARDSMAARFIALRRGRKFIVWHDYTPEPHMFLGVGEYLREEFDQLAGGGITHVKDTCVAFYEVP